MKKLIVSTLLVLTLFSEASAKVGDPEPLVRDGVEYSSHLNIVKALRKADSKVLWETTIPVNVRATIKDPNLEVDVQLDRIIRMTFHEELKVIMVVFNSGQVFGIDPETGKSMDVKFSCATGS